MTEAQATEMLFYLEAIGDCLGLFLGFFLWKLSVYARNQRDFWAILVVLIPTATMAGSAFEEFEVAKEGMPNNYVFTHDSVCQNGYAIYKDSDNSRYGQNIVGTALPLYMIGTVQRRVWLGGAGTSLYYRYFAFGRHYYVRVKATTGFTSYYVLNGTSCLLGEDTDGDGQLDKYDDDDDDDGIKDWDDQDDDGDGVIDEDDPDYKYDYDKDGIHNLIDWDDDGDGINDIIDDDQDGDGLIDSIDDDDDGDGVSDVADADQDGDGVDNQVDLDMDGDGVPNWSDSDIDGDGITNSEDPDLDGDGINNSGDSDENNDGITDSAVDVGECECEMSSTMDWATLCPSMQQAATVWQKWNWSPTTGFVTPETPVVSTCQQYFGENGNAVRQYWQATQYEDLVIVEGEGEGEDEEFEIVLRWNIWLQREVVAPIVNPADCDGDGIADESDNLPKCLAQGDEGIPDVKDDGCDLDPCYSSSCPDFIVHCDEEYPDGGTTDSDKSSEIYTWLTREGTVQEPYFSDLDSVLSLDERQFSILTDIPSSGLAVPTSVDLGIAGSHSMPVAGFGYYYSSFLPDGFLYNVTQVIRMTLSVILYYKLGTMAIKDVWDTFA